MKNIGLIMLVLILHSCISTKSQKEKLESNDLDLVIENVKLFNSKTKQVFENKTILIKGDKIVSIIDSGSKNYQAKQTIKGNGKLVVPGFIDTHVHLTQIFGDGNETAPEFIGNDDSYRQVLTQHYLHYGTTTILDLGQPEKWLAVSLQWQKTPSPKYPNIYNAGGALISDFDREPNMNHTEILNRQHAKEKIKEYSNKGIKHIKLYSYLNEEDLIPVVEEASVQGISVFGHLDRGQVNVARAMELDIKNFEHFFTLINSVLTTSEHWIELNNKYNLGRIRSVDEWAAAMILYFDYVDTNPVLKDQLDRLINTMIANDVNISTTISVFASIAKQSDFFSSFTTFPIRSSSYFPSYTNLDKATLENAFQTMMKYLKEANERGLKIRIGTDCRYGGKAMHNELILLAKAGISVGDVLQMATWNGAEAMKIDDQYGLVEKGKIADLIIFEKNPFDDYNNFSSEKTIIKSGQVFEPKNSLTNDLLTMVNNKGVNKTIEWYNAIKDSQDYYPHHEYQINEVAHELFKLNKAEEAIDVLEFCFNTFEQAGSQFNSLSEQQLNSIGYHFLELKNTFGAIEIFKFNTKLFPESWNVYDSLGEAYLLNGNKKLAKENYEKSLAINPDNDFAVEVLKKLEK